MKLKLKACPMIKVSSLYSFAIFTVFPFSFLPTSLRLLYQISSHSFGEICKTKSSTESCCISNPCTLQLYLVNKRGNHTIKMIVMELAGLRIWFYRHCSWLGACLLDSMLRSMLSPGDLQKARDHSISPPHQMHWLLPHLPK